MPAGFTARLPLSRHGIDRDHLSRARPELFDELRADPDARAVVLRRGEALLAEGDGRAGLALVPLAAVPSGAAVIYLGRAVDGGAPYVAAVLDDDAPLDPSLGVARFGSLRELGEELDDLQAGLFTEALALANWHASHGFSPRTGAPAAAALGGWVRRAEGDEHEMFPRTDAAVIVGVTDEHDRLLLGSNAMWRSNRYSLLAGFVEPGESLEAAVEREVFEESGIHVTDAEYLGSQPWPFPASLMVGFRARVDPARPSRLRADGEEILDVRWFGREELAASLDEIVLPGGTSIARAIIEDWYGGPIDDRRPW